MSDANADPSRIWGPRPLVRISRAELPPALRDTTRYDHADVVGDVATLTQPCIGIVGTRNLNSRQGEDVRAVVEDIVRSVGRPVVSGGALGVDRIAHEVALEAGVPTVVILASGIERAGPAAHHDLFRQIADGGGAVVGFGPPTRRPFRGCFLARNRTIAAMAEAVVVAAAPKRSGALSTAAAARGMGRPVLAVPGPARAVAWEGCHQLLRDGARICTGPEDVLKALGEASQGRLELPRPPARRLAPVDDQARALWEELQAGGTFDAAARAIGVDAAVAQTLLLELQLAGYDGV